MLRIGRSLCFEPAMASFHAVVPVLLEDMRGRDEVTDGDRNVRRPIVQLPRIGLPRYGGNPSRGYEAEGSHQAYA